MNVLYKKLSFQFCIQKSFYIDDDGAAFQSKAQFQGHLYIYIKDAGSRLIIL
jgi:hypothetical protein